MGYNDTYKDLMQNLKNENQASQNPSEFNTTTTVYDDFKLTINNDVFEAAGLTNVQRILVYISNNQNAVYLSDKNSLGNEFGISKILKHKPMTGLRLNIGKILNIGKVPCEVIVQIQNGMIKIYPKDGISKPPADKAFAAVCDTIEKVYGFDINEFLNRIAEGVI